MVDVLVQLAHRKGLIAKMTGAALLIGVILAFTCRSLYGNTRIMPPQQTQSTASMLMNQLPGSAEALWPRWPAEDWV